MDLALEVLERAQDALEDYDLGSCQLYLAAAVGLVTLYFLVPLLRPDSEAAVDYTVPIPEECKPGWKGEVLENPSLKVPGSSAIQCYAPATGYSLGLINPATPAGIDRAIASARAAQQQWRNTTFSQRRRVLKTILKYILENQETISTAACLDSGKTRVDSSFGEILMTAEKLKWTIDHGEAALKPERRPTNFLMAYKKNEVWYEPLGVVAAMVSWNYPFHNLLGPIISAIFAGNGIVVKGSEATAWSSTYFISIVQTALQVCGHPPDLVQSVVCWPSVAPHLTSHPSIAHLTFIGSRPVAHHVAKDASRSLTPLCVELGGKDAAIILDDIDSLPRVASILLRGVFQSAGQNCVGIERVIATPGIYPQLLARVEPLIRALRSGSVLDCTDPSDEPVDVGASISDASFDTLEALIAEAVAEGARLLVGGRRLIHPRWPKGHYFQPTLLADVTPSMRIAQQECFAPIFLLMPARDATEAVAIANGTPYALGASVFGRERGPTVDRIVAALEAGMVSVNDFAVYYAVQLPFGGAKGSGYGRFAGAEGLRGLCNVKAVCRDRWPALRVRTRIPAPLDLPVRDLGRAWRMCQGVCELGYGESLARRVRGLGKLVGF